jgi:predicted DCC family thiol-disulfide oxidoreductase YuxK
MVLLYDGTCGFCDWAVKLVLRHDRQKTLKFAALKGVYGSGVIATHPELADVDSVMLVDENTGGVLVRSEAAMAIGRYLGGVWALSGIARVVPRSIRDAMYDLFARHRYRFFGRLESCAVPDKAVRERFLE